MMITPIVGNDEGTVGLCTTGPDRSGSVRIPGYFDKLLLKEAIDKYFDLFPNRDFEIRFLEMPESGSSSCLLIYPSDSKEVAICVAGKTGREA